VNELALFAGAGGGILGGHLLGWRTVCAVEWEPYPASVLCARQNDGLLPSFPIWDDVQTFDGRPWRGIVDVISGGFPCQDISAAGKGAGIDGERSGMWREMARVIHEVRPRFVFVENSPMLTSRGLGTVLGDLASMGFDARWGVLGAADVGAPHQRDRIWIVAYANRKHDALRGDGSNNAESMARRTGEFRGSIGDSGAGCQESAGQGSDVADTSKVGLPSSQAKQGVEGGLGFAVSSLAGRWWDREPGETPRTVERGLGGMVNGMAARVDRLKAIGNGQVSEVARRAWEILSDQR
jgi:DNA (cytosine-5)-methyltransferase 1